MATMTSEEKKKIILHAVIDNRTKRPEAYEKEVKKAKERLAQAKINMMLNNPFFGSILFELEFVPDRLVEYSATDARRVIYNPFMVNALPMDEVETLLAHEVLHIVFLHVPAMRSGKYKPDLYNIAGDYVINLHLEQCGFKFNILDEGCYKDNKFEGWTTEEVYEHLLKNEFPSAGGNKKGDSVSGAGAAGGCNSGGHNNENGGNDDNHEHKHGHGSYDESEPGGRKPITEEEFWDEMEALGRELKKQGIKLGRGCCRPGDNKSVNEQRIKEMIARASTIARQQGKLPGNLKEVITKILYPKVPWQEVLREFIEESFLGDYDWNYPDRRYMQYGMVLPDQHEYALGEIVICIDTSGSITKEQLERMAAETNAIFSQIQPTKVWVIYCDAQVQKVDEYDKGEELKFELIGGGGTDFRPPFKWIEENSVNPRCLLYFTDGWGVFPRNEPDFPVLWATFKGTSEQGDYPWGRVVEVEI